MSGKSGHLAQLLLIQRERDSLRATNCKLRDKLLELAKQCKECDGAGVITERRDGRGHLVSALAYDSGRILTEHQVPCPGCADIREVLE